ncbi:MAG TPA: hypothetical protein VKV21_00125 [Solirubrobacteraceae bacterium]|nr:hypothetical protein [Solirubrobacteraceae bacterium]
MRANRAYRLIITPGGHEPRFLAERGRHDRIEVVSIADGEPLLFWDVPAREAARLVRELREDLVAMSAEEFLALWEGADRA